MNALRALVLLTLDGIRRLLREGIVLRSLTFPVVLALFAVGGTVIAVLLLQPPPRLAIPPALDASPLAADVRADDWEVLVTDTPEEAVVDGTAALATDGTTLWIGAGGHPPLRLEAIVRTHLQTRWRPVQPPKRRAAEIQESEAPRQLAVFIGALFALYGVVFGAGSVARDRDEGTLDAELSTAVPHVVHGLARWLAGSLVLGGFYGLSVALVDAIMGVQDALQLALAGLASCAASTAVGLGVIGRAGLDRGFAGPMSAGLVAVFSVLSAGLADRAAGAYLPIASLVVRDASWPIPLGVACAMGIVASLAFARRTAVS
ncbi:MAG: hypothetical protein H6732_02860 [Alphaproteobacteria bacterium]|nr:hypothetical protein [Alphaproteobacteria bacterium]